MEQLMEPGKPVRLPSERADLVIAILQAIDAREQERNSRLPQEGA